MNKRDKEQIDARGMFDYEFHFEPIPKSRSNYKYTLKVWLTSVLLGTTLFFAFKSLQEISNPSGPVTAGSSTVFYYIIAVAIGLICSIPCLLLFAAGYNFIAGYIFSSIRIKLTLSIVGQALCWLSFYIGFGVNNGEALFKNLDITLPYAIATAFSVFAYKLSSDN
jgi:uncharacterized membrane protein YGL010W